MNSVDAVWLIVYAVVDVVPRRPVWEKGVELNVIRLTSWDGVVVVLEV